MWFVCGSVLGRIRTLFRPKEAEAGRVAWLGEAAAQAAAKDAEAAIAQRKALADKVTTSDKEALDAVKAAEAEVIAGNAPSVAEPVDPNAAVKAAD